MHFPKFAAFLLAGLVFAANSGVASAADAVEKPDAAACLACHGNEGFAMPGADGKTRNLHVAKEKFEKSVHAKLLTCVDCHQDNAQVPHKEGKRAKADCGTCHSAVKDEYLQSVHGQASVVKGNPGAATCASCHTVHEVAPAKTDAFRLTVTQACGTCHQDRGRSFKDTYHGKIDSLGYAHTAKCFDCHGNHGILSAANPKSTVHPDNRLQTCQKCHTGATKGFVSYEPHANTHDFERYPSTWLASKFMFGLLAGTFAFFWTHTLLWFYREYRERKQGKTRTLVMEAALPQAAGKVYQRFSPMWRIAHLVFALSLMILTLTGMSVLYAESAWAPVVMQFLGGPKVAAVIHRVCAVIFTVVFIGHLIYIVVRIARNWKAFKIFGPNSLIPGPQDLWDIIAMFKWFFGKGPRPVFDRWTYWEKFDYWAPFWGVSIIGVSGAMLWFPNLTASFLPGWVFNVAAIVHSEEAILAVVFLFTVHFFNNHLRPDKFPLDIVMFTGTFTLEEFRREHALEYQRLVASGELEKYLVEAPSRPMTIGSKILGFTLMAVGFALLALVVNGFLGSL